MTRDPLSPQSKHKKNKRSKYTGRWHIMLLKGELAVTRYMSSPEWKQFVEKITGAL